MPVCLERSGQHLPSGCAGLCLFSAGRRCGELGSPDPLQGLLDGFLAAVDVEDSVREAGIGHELGQNRGDVVTWDAALERCRSDADTSRARIVGQAPGPDDRPLTIAGLHRLVGLGPWPAGRR